MVRTPQLSNLAAALQALSGSAMGDEKTNCDESALWRIAKWLLLTLGISLFCMGLCTVFIFPVAVESQIRKNANLREGTEMYEKWLNPPYKSKTEIYVYSVKNPDEILNGSKPEVRTIGPYVYSQKMGKEVFAKGNGTIKYASFELYTFNANKSCAECSLQHKVWIPNIVFQKFVEAASNPSMRAAQAALTSQTPFLEVSVGDMLFKGYKDPFLDKVCSIPFMSFICEAVLDLPDKIAFLADSNNTKADMLKVSTGEEDGGETLGQIETWNGEKYVPDSWWSDEFSTKVNGTDGSLYKPFIDKSDKLYIFVPGLCRSIYFIFDRDVEYKGVHGYRFIVPSNLFDWSRPENEAFCYNSGKEFFKKDEDCLPKGLIDISRCRRGEPPIIVSLPNFLFADNIVKDSVVGLNESSPEHDSIAVTLEPRTGVVLLVEKRYQINIAMWKGNEITAGIDLSRMRSCIVPVISIFTTVEIDDGSLKLLYDRLLNVEKLVSAFCITTVLIGSLISGVTVAVMCAKSSRLKRLLEKGQRQLARVSVAPDQTEKPFSMNHLNSAVH
ncbi:Lysosome membrane protein 2 [Toxocara canis]|uniref:Lysosome membrane protein 2 n=1 Tax=Toxocara canis TaxID=6265 RepID=A0A0B2W5Z7_TOXCA|nr:Lysosome membrane protein 2 [Toxocara canis]